jgi:hypothetical protein
VSDDVIISVEHLSKRYRLGQIGATTLRESAERLWHRLRGRDPDEHMGKIGTRQVQADRNSPRNTRKDTKEDQKSRAELAEGAERRREEHRACPEDSGQTAQEPQEDRKPGLRSPEVSEPGPLRGPRDAVAKSASPFRVLSCDSWENSSSDNLWALKDVSFEILRFVVRQSAVLSRPAVH